MDLLDLAKFRNFGINVESLGQLCERGPPQGTRGGGVWGGEEDCVLFRFSVTRLGDFLHFGQPFKAGGNNYFTQIAYIVRQFL